MDRNLQSRLFDRNGVVDRFLRENGGGCKMPEVAARVLVYVHAGEGSPSDKKDFNFDEFEALLSKSPFFGVLEYFHDLGESCNGPFRTKAFVYRKHV